MLWGLWHLSLAVWWCLSKCTGCVSHILSAQLCAGHCCHCCIFVFEYGFSSLVDTHVAVGLLRSYTSATATVNAAAAVSTADSAYPVGGTKIDRTGACPLEQQDLHLIVHFGWGTIYVCLCLPLLGHAGPLTHGLNFTELCTVCLFV